MKILIALICLTAGLNSAWSAEDELLPGFALVTDVEFENAGATQKLNTETIFDKELKTWAQVKDINNQVNLMARVTGGKDEILVEYKLVDKKTGSEIPKDEASKYRIQGEAKSIYYTTE